MASLASSIAKAKTGSNRLHGGKSTKGEAIVQCDPESRGGCLAVAPELRKAGIASTAEVVDAADGITTPSNLPAWKLEGE